MAFSRLEHEVIILNAAWDMIDGMVNLAIFVRPDEARETNLYFHSAAEAKLFNILLGDFLSLPQPRANKPAPFNLPLPGTGVSASNLTSLYYLRQVCAHPCLGTDIYDLATTVEAFGQWLEATTDIERVWFPDISLETPIRISRIEYLRICADISKHNLARLQSNVRKLCRILQENGTTIDENQGFLALPNFYEWFHDDLFIYHSSVIGEFLNNIRLAIFHYLQQEYTRSHSFVEPAPMYTYDVPAEVQAPLARAMYWDLMNRVRATPYMGRFRISESFKER